MRRWFVATGIVFLVGLVIAIGGSTAPALGQDESLGRDEALNPYPLRPPDTSSPRATLQSFQQNMRETVQRLQDRDSPAAVDRATVGMLRCLDLSELPPAEVIDRGFERGLFLLEILDRIELPPPEEIPDAAAVESAGLTSWTIPNTEITIARTEDGPYAGEFQFTAHTIDQLPAFYRRAEHLPYKPRALIGIYEDVVYSPGPWLPLAWTSHLPAFAYVVVLGQTIWQWLAALATLGLTLAVVVVAYLLGRRVDRATSGAGPRGSLGRLVATLVVIPLVHLSSRVLDDAINIAGTRLFVLDFALGVLVATAVGWLIVLVLNAIGEAIIRSRAAGPGSVDAHLVRIVVRLLTFVVLIYLALYLADSLGIPVAPLVASLGVGGLAIALAVRPTLENIVGGFILFADKPVRVGEFCEFGDKMGTIEEIGLRSTRLRALDRTLITVPNADFAQLQIVNFTRRDQMLLRTTLGLRYETTPDQLRYVLTRLRELFVAHPKVAPEPGRARFIGFGDFSLNVEIFIYVLSDNYNEFLGIAEDLNLRIMDIVAEAGTGFAFPSQTAYLTRDQGLDAERTKAAEAEVQVWREGGALPFPGLAPDRVNALHDTLDFPPQGSSQPGEHAGPGDPARVTEPARHRRWSVRRSQGPEQR